MPSVSVIIPTYDRSEMLYRAVQSVLSQTYQDFEILVINDASHTNVAEILDQFNCDKIKLVFHDINRGEAASRNTGIRASQSEYLAFLDDDDEWLPHKLDEQVSILRESSSGTGLVYSGFHYVDWLSQKVILSNVPEARGNIYEKLLKKNLIITPSSVVVKRECLEKVGLFDESIDYGTDYDLWIRICRHFDVECTGTPLVKYHVHENSLSKNLVKSISGFDSLLRKYPSQLNRAQYGKKYFSIGVEMMNSGDLRNGMRTLMKSVKLNPGEIRIYPYLVAGFLGKNMFSKYVKVKEVVKHHIGLPG